MRQSVGKRNSLLTPDSGAKSRRTWGIVMGMLFVGWLAGSFLIGSVNYPTFSNAAITETSDTVMQENSTQGFAEIAKSVTPAVVNITAAKAAASSSAHDPFDSLREFWGIPDHPRIPRGPFGMGLGSGVIVSPDGHVVTNYHVIEDAREVTVKLPDKREFPGKVVGTDPQSDLAILKIEGTNFPYLQWGDSSELKVGDYVLAVGNPFGLNSTVTQGIVSAMGRGGMGISQYEDFIQTDAAINPGNSGGALVNTSGELVGINTAIVSRTGGYQGVGFAVPAGMAKPVYKSLIKTGKVVRGYLGIGIQSVTNDLASTLNLKDANGALVTEVRAGSPAEKAGITRGDTIVKYQGVPVSDPRALQRAVIRTPVGTAAILTVVRDGRETELGTTIAENPESKRMAKVQDELLHGPLAGVTVEGLDERLAQRLGVDDQTEGVVVAHVESGSQADRAGLNRGDVISEINKKSIQSVQDYEQRVASIGKDPRTLLLIYRNGTPLFLIVKA